MAKPVSEFVCQTCGHRAPKWLGKCPECQGWNTLAEEITPHPRAGRQTAGSRNSRANSADPSVQAITQITHSQVGRMSTGILEFDRTLGGGLVPGSLTLLGGDPGIGKSTLMLQSMGAMAEAGHRVLYVSGEESPEQIKLRAERLHCLSEQLLICSEICIENVLGLLDKIQPEVLVLDSIQTFFTGKHRPGPGSGLQDFSGMQTPLTASFFDRSHH